MPVQFHAEMSVIRPINSQSVHQICSGQVILDLATAVKELLENALDAGAFVIEIKLKDHGISSIEVLDNGQGIEEADYEGLTKKHHTSKLHDFADLTSVETFGFRGEALSSLCALSNMIVTTRFKTSKTGHRLEYDQDGKLLKKTCIARQPGTSVVLKNLFSPLPVRHVEFKKNVKREFSKLVNLLYSYCVICTDVKVSCINEVKDVKREVFRTSGSKSIQDSIVTLFGSKLFKSLVRFEQTPPTEESCGDYRLCHNECVNFSKECLFTGYISSCGSGRRSSDMQYISVNKRPCHVPKFCKLINEIFRLFNKNQYPFVQLDISTKRDQVDINVTPDKRHVFLTHEKALLAILKSSLLKVYNGMSHKIESVDPQPSILAQLQCKDMRKLPTVHTPIENGCCHSRYQSTVISNCMAGVISKKSHDFRQFTAAFVYPSDVNDSVSVTLTEKCDDTVSGISSMTKMESVHVDQRKDHEEKQPLDDTCQSLHAFTSSNTGNVKNMMVEVMKSSLSSSIKKTERPINDNSSYRINRPTEDQSDTSARCETSFQPELRAFNQGVTKIDQAENVPKVHRPLSFSFHDLKDKWHLKKKIRHLSSDKFNSMRLSSGNFKAKIVSSENDRAEKELSKHFNRASFKDMEIMGQFNLGFIIAKHSKDLFIIDQHASDEKYNFEMLQKNTKLNGQSLIIPQKLELTASDIMVLEENMAIFEQNGFSFEIRESNVGIKSAFLLKVPSSKNLVFDASDVAELVFILRDHPHTLCRPSRIQQMFASRACRKSIMIGSPLTYDAMKQIISHMSEMEQPWNCPHGRPTMRHLIDLAMIAKPEVESIN